MGKSLPDRILTQTFSKSKRLKKNAQNKSNFSGHFVNFTDVKFEKYFYKEDFTHILR